MRGEIEAFCGRIGADPLLVQGAGGNVSWKENGTLWVKASGTWLAHAPRQDIFVPVDLRHLVSAIEIDDFSVQPKLAAHSSLRPSIETLLHALMPQPVVVHLHAVDVLAHLVRASFPSSVAACIPGQIKWLSVPYRKPGEDLARVIAKELGRTGDANAVMMQSHGLVIGGRNIDEVENYLTALTAALRVKPRAASGKAVEFLTELQPVYKPSPDNTLHELAFDLVLFDRLKRDWALYPDHVVFLGPEPACYTTVRDFLRSCPDQAKGPPVVFIKDTGVFVHNDITDAKLAQLRCYYDVLARQGAEEQLITLEPDQIAQLLDWDAEKYRMALSGGA